MNSILSNCFGCVRDDRDTAYFWVSEPQEVQRYQQVQISKSSEAIQSDSEEKESDGPKNIYSKPLFVRVFDDAVPAGMCEEVLKIINARGFTYGWQSNWDMGYGHWNLVFGGYQKLHRDCVEHEIPKITLDIWRYIQPRFMKDTPVLIRCYSNSHTYGVEGYPHTDSKEETDVTAILYLNKAWKREWAGETAFFDGQDISYSIIPKFARIVVFRSTIWHTARSLSRICPTDRVVLVFKARTTLTAVLPKTAESSKQPLLATVISDEAKPPEGTRVLGKATPLPHESTVCKACNSVILYIKDAEQSSVFCSSCGNSNQLQSP